MAWTLRLPASAMRKPRQAQPLSSLIGKIAAKSFEARGLVAAGIANEWPAIVGEAVAASSWPERLGRDGTLRVCVSGPVAVELQHLEPQILERIAAFYGYRAVTRIAYVNRAPLPEPARVSGRRTPPKIDSESVARVETAVDSTRDHRLKSALAALGRAVAARSQRK